MRVLAGESKKKEAQGTKGKIIIETHVDTTLSVLRALDLDRVHRLLETRLGEEGGSVADSSADGDELSSTSVDGVGVKGNIHLVTKGERERSVTRLDQADERNKTTEKLTMLNRIPRMFSSQTTPSLVAHWKAATHESLISLRYWTPLVTSTSLKEDR
jgi:hypothetical protein